jgi:hypothetical protein
MRKESLVQRVTREVETAHAAEFQARAHKAAERETAVAAKSGKLPRPTEHASQPQERS